MDRLTVYKKIKKQNGETFAKQIRNYNERIFCVPDLVEKVRYAGSDAKPILEYLNSFARDRVIMQDDAEDPFKLLSEAGYDAFYADTLKKQNSIQKYFDKKEQLCTFRDNKRFQNYYIIHAVKKDVDQILRKDFPHPEREDAYGRSVISIQILKTGGYISIKNRYNHTVPFCDNTFDSNPDNIIEGLSNALQKYFKVSFSASEYRSIPNGYIVCGNKILKINREIDGVSFGNDFYVYNGKIFEIQKDYQCMAEYYLFDLKEKRVYSFIDSKDPFANLLTKEMEGKTVQIKKNKSGYTLLLNNEEFIKVNENASFTAVTLFQATHLPSQSFSLSGSLNKFIAPKLRTMGDNCFIFCPLTELSVPELKTMGNNCFEGGCKADRFVFENLRRTGNNCFSIINTRELIVPKLKVIESFSIKLCDNLEKVYAPNVRLIETSSVCQNRNLKMLYIPQCVEIVSEGIQNNRKLRRLDLLRVRCVGFGSIVNNTELTDIYAPKLKQTGSYSFSENASKCYIEAPKLVTAGYMSFQKVSHLYAPQLSLRQLDLDWISFLLIKHRQFIKKNERAWNFFGLLNHYRKYNRGR